MRIHTHTYISWFVLALAVAACGAVLYASIWIRAEAKARGAHVLSAEQRAEESAMAARRIALAADTADERAQLENIARADIVTVANAIEEAGKRTGVLARVSTALPVGGQKEIPGGTSLQGLAFIVQAEGTFQGIMSLLRALETFPAFSEVDQFDMEKVQDAGARAGLWRATIRIIITTTSDVS